MKILFDQGTPAPLRQHLAGHSVETVSELGWSNLGNGALLLMAEDSFDLLITTDQQLHYQQNLAGRKLRILVLMTTSWPRIKLHVTEVEEAVAEMDTGEYRELTLN